MKADTLNFIKISSQISRRRLQQQPAPDSTACSKNGRRPSCDTCFGVPPLVPVMANLCWPSGSPFCDTSVMSMTIQTPSIQPVLMVKLATASGSTKVGGTFICTIMEIKRCIIRPLQFIRALFCMFFRDSSTSQVGGDPHATPPAERHPSLVAKCPNLRLGVLSWPDNSLRA